MKTIYIVSSGCYSDYHIDAVFDSKELAEKFVETFNENNMFHNQMRIEEWELNPLKKELKKDFNPYFVRMKRNGDTIEIGGCIYPSDYIEKETKLDYEGNMLTYVMARDEKHAIKIANERRVQFIASGQWGFTRK